LQPASLRNGWALPAFIADMPDLSNPQAGLKFLQCLDWSGILDACPAMAGEGVLSRPDSTDVNLIFDQASTPVGLLVRTSEPFDWRRLEVMLATGQKGNFTERLKVGLIPSPDGCSCLLLAKAEKITVRLQQGSYVARCRFHLEAPSLPRLTASDDHTRKFEEFLFTFVQPYGKSW
jgi:hypothetical protein